MFRKTKKRQARIFSTLKEIELESVQKSKETEPIPFEASSEPVTPVTPEIVEQRCEDSPNYLPIEETNMETVQAPKELESTSSETSPAISANKPIEPTETVIKDAREIVSELGPESHLPVEEIEMEESAVENVRAENLVSLFENSFVSIDPGTFLMGSAEYEVGRDNREVLHEVTLTKGFYMQTTPVTQAQWRSVMVTNPSKFTEGGDECPVENVTWHDCLDFIKTLNRMGEVVYRLPTEAEWEYTCRAGSLESSAEGMIMELFCGHDPSLDAVGWYCGNSDRRTHPVASKNANKWGLYDMHGNVFEWCQDWYGPYSSEKSIDPLMSWPGPGRVIRGGSWFANAKNCRSAARLYWLPQSKNDFIGFRLVKEAG